ncbi:hypothetical protein Clacol_007463 [Clathrus columnatus]|uniref:aminodeoxychorismate synthase n=1 Tax=Clathrus columnatus TaxID=1419009 RepID=A0AAV5AHS9_9AGAM|nr:hypothetical protein Clacol_007463 [Clathrus columnatus]
MAECISRILLIDSYDSFTHNLAHLIRRVVPFSHIYLIQNDSINQATLLDLLPSFSAVVVGPGPGSPANASDIGIIPHLWTLPDCALLPIFGVCLGFQSLGLALGGKLRIMEVVKHGMVSTIEHTKHDLFMDVSESVVATRYHSLCIDFDPNIITNLDFEPLAWTDDGEDNGQVLMAGRHRNKPFWGVQYHPESICTKGCGEEVISNFWRMACEWSEANKRVISDLPSCVITDLGSPWPRVRLSTPISKPAERRDITVNSIVVDQPVLNILEICELLGAHTNPATFVMLDSAAKSGRFTIIGSLMPNTLWIRYTLPDSYLLLQRGNGPPQEIPLSSTSIWSWIGDLMDQCNVSQMGSSDIPFWGGLIGYLSYELGVQELGVSLINRDNKSHRNPDVNLIFVERSVVIDNQTGRTHVQSILPNDHDWLQNTSRLLKERDPIHGGIKTECKLDNCIISPAEGTYVSRVKECKYHLSIGSSYELCLTAPSILRISSETSTWELYKRLRVSNPAPHAAYLRLGPTSLLCSSPERFLKWDRNGNCELRPIKGTLRKKIIDDSGNYHQMGRKDAEELLGNNVKERAENLMIVDLVRHDLGGIVRAADGVTVDQLMVIEEYETVWQMVSGITGTVDADGEGWEALRRSLPPGSMTGAPKKRSVELLQEIEGQERGIYSGVCGYWCVGGGGDWAVIIRSCFRFDDQCVNGREPHPNGEDEHLNSAAPKHDWILGAGGAITALSDPFAEWEEMHVKLASVGRAFGASALFAVGQLLRTLEFSPVLPSESFLPHPKSNRSNRVDPVTFLESPSASSNASSPGVLDILQTPSDTSPLAPRLPHIPDFLSDQFRNTSNNAKNGAPFTFDSHNSVQGTLHGLPGKPYDHLTFKGYPTISQFPTPIYDFSPHSSNISSGRVIPTTSYPIVDKPTPSSSIYATSPTLSTTYQGIFNPFDNDTNAGTRLTRFLDNNSSPNEDLSKLSHRQGGSLSNNFTWPQSMTPSIDYTYHVPPPTSSSLYSTPFERNPLDPVPGRINNPTISTQFENKNIPSFTSQTIFDPRPSTQVQPRQTSPHVPHGSGTNAPDSDMATRDMLRNLAVAGLNRHREKQRSVSVSGTSEEPPTRASSGYGNASPPETSNDSPSSEKQANEPINFLHLLSPTAVPPYSHFITRIIKSSDQQASIFLQQKLKIADATERKKIVDAVSQKGIEMMTNRFGNWAVQRCLEPPCELADRMKVVQCMKGHVVELATNCYGTHVLQKALDCEEDIRVRILIDSHFTHSASAYKTTVAYRFGALACVNKSLAGKWASLACHETGSLVVQTAFEQCEEADKEVIIGELLDEEAFSEVVTNAWVLEHGVPHHRAKAVDNLIKGLSQYASHEQSIKCVLKALKEGGPEVLDRVVARLCEPPKGGRRASLVDISLSPIGSQLVGTILPNVNKEQRSALYEAIRGHVVTLRGSRVGSKVIWLFFTIKLFVNFGIMGKAQKKKAMRRHNPIRVPDSHLPQGLATASSTSSKHEAVLPIISKLSAIDSTERVWACAAVSTLIHNDPSTRRLLQGKNIVGELITRLSDAVEEVLVEAAGALRYDTVISPIFSNLCIDGGHDICAEMYNKNILAPLRTFPSKISAALQQILEAPESALEDTQRLVCEFAENVITIFWCLAETSNKALKAVNEIDLIPFLVSFLRARNRLPQSTVNAAAQCIYVLTEDNDVAIQAMRSDATRVSTLLDIAQSEPAIQNANNDIKNIRWTTLHVLISGTLKNISPLPRNMSASNIDLERSIILPLLVTQLSYDLDVMSNSVVQSLTQLPNRDIAKTIPSLQHAPKSDYKTPAELELHRIEETLYLVQLTLEILTGICTKLPDELPYFKDEITG